VGWSLKTLITSISNLCTFHTQLLTEVIERDQIQPSPIAHPVREIKSITEEYESLRPPTGTFEFSEDTNAALSP